MGYGSGIARSYGVGHRHGSDLALLWPWHRPAATAPIRPLAWEPPYAAGAALKRQKKSTVFSSSFGQEKEAQRSVDVSKCHFSYSSLNPYAGLHTPSRVLLQDPETEYSWTPSGL